MFMCLDNLFTYVYESKVVVCFFFCSLWRVGTVIGIYYQIF